LRIIGGRYRGRRIEPPSGFRSRPTTDFAREALFNILSNRIDLESVSVLDLFSGTGSVSFEFASRGATLVHSIEKEMKHFSGILRIIKDIGITGIKPIRADVRTYLNACRMSYDIVFADPPYDLGWITELPGLVTCSGVMKNKGIFILEHPGSLDFSDHELFSEHRRYGEVNFTFFRAPASDKE